MLIGLQGEILIWLALACLPAMLLPPLGREVKFPARREIVAVVCALILIPLMLAFMPPGYAAWIYSLFWGFWLPAFVVGIAGRRPFLYGFLIGLAHLFGLILKLLPYLSQIAPEVLFYQLQSMAIWIAAILLVSMLGVVPVALVWRIKHASE
jgi:hypothetical protein